MQIRFILHPKIRYTLQTQTIRTKHLSRTLLRLHLLCAKRGKTRNVFDVFVKYIRTNET